MIKTSVFFLMGSFNTFRQMSQTTFWLAVGFKVETLFVLFLFFYLFFFVGQSREAKVETWRCVFKKFLLSAAFVLRHYNDLT